MQRLSRAEVGLGRVHELAELHRRPATSDHGWSRGEDSRASRPGHRRHVEGPLTLDDGWIQQERG
jgi:hypothetical protein